MTVLTTHWPTITRLSFTTDSAAGIVVITRQLTIQHHLLYVVQHDAFMPIWPLSTRM